MQILPKLSTKKDTRALKTDQKSSTFEIEYIYKIVYIDGYNYDTNM